MSLLVVGLSHHSAELSLLERVALDPDAAAELTRAARSGEHVSEAMSLATCNRVELYADVATFHGGLSDLGAALSATTGVPLEDLAEHLYVHYEDRAVAHLFTVVCGLDSMAVGEGQILGQVRQALRRAQAAGDLGRVLDQLLQQALRVGKRAHAETGIDAAGRSIIAAGLDRAIASLAATAAGSVPAADLASVAAVAGVELPGRLAVLVVGAGSMSSLAAATVHRLGVAELTIANRTRATADRLAAELDARAVPLEELASALAAADLIVSCTGARGHMIAADLVEAAQQSRGGRAQAYVDLGLPRDVDPAAGDLPGVTIVDLEVIGRDLDGGPLSTDVSAVRDLVAEEVAEYLMQRRAESVAPTVVALRARAAEVVAAELARLEQRRPDLEPDVREELRRTVNRVVDKLLHAPTVRVKELAGVAEPSDYAAALRELFDLGPAEAASVPADRLDEVIDIGSPR